MTLWKFNLEKNECIGPSVHPLVVPGTFHIGSQTSRGMFLLHENVDFLVLLLTAVIATGYSVTSKHENSPSTLWLSFSLGGQTNYCRVKTLDCAFQSFQIALSDFQRQRYKYHLFLYILWRSKKGHKKASFSSGWNYSNFRSHRLSETPSYLYPGYGRQYICPAQTSESQVYRVGFSVLRFSQQTT